MEGKYRGKAQVFGPVLTDLKGMGKRSLEWDLNDWKWDGDVFVASPLSLAPSDCRGRQLFPLRPETVENTHVSNSSPSCSDEGNLINDKGKRELEKRRRDVVPDEQLDDLTGSLNLELGQQVYPIADVDLEEKSGKKTKVAGSTSNHPVCQVDDCDADLSNAKDYHRRHKVCDVHSKASKALVGNVVQRFCQQCSRFHGLQEFDEGKRSCRRRLAGHNRRRRKTHPETSVNAGSLNDERNSGYLLITLLRILCNLHSNTADQSKDQDLLSYLLRNLATLTGTNNNISGLLQGSQGLLNAGASNGTPEKGLSVAHQQVEKETVPSNEAQKKLLVANGQPEYSRPPRVPDSTTSPVLVRENEPEAATQRHQLNNIDLNTVYNESEDCADNPGGLQASLPSQYRAQGLHKSFPAQTNAKSCSTYSSFLFSSSRSEAQSCTDRIVFKLFGKDPNDLPHVLRTQILDWLSHSPTDIEGYIRPGCIVLTIYLRLSKSSWYELCYNLSSSLSRLLDISNDSFWKQGWIYASLGHHAAFIYDGQVVLDTPLPIRSYRSCRISSISPIAVPASERVQFVVRGFNLSQSVSRLLCAVEGKYLVQENCFSLVADADSVVQHDEIQCLSFSCSMPNASGRGFIEVEDYGLSGSFFPFIIAEPEICSEVCTLERLMDIIDPDDDDTDSHSQEFEARNQALDFIHEMGWLLHRNGLKSRLEQVEPFVGLFPFERIKWLVEFAIDHNWCAVVRKLIDVLLSGTVDAGGYSSVEEALSEMGLLHTAVRRNCKSMVESLLTYRMKTIEGTSERDSSKGSSYLFIPDVIGPGGLTPLHVAACSDSSEKVLEALIDDPGMVGIDAWKNACDSTGLTPNDYASLRGHYSYIHLVQRKLDQNSADKHVMIDIPNTSDTKTEPKPASKAQTQPVKLNIFHTDKLRFETAHKQCSLCLKKLDYGFRGTTFTCRPAMLSLVAIAAVCVCVALLFKSSPEVLYVSKPFNWEKLDYGAM